VGNGKAMLKLSLCFNRVPRHEGVLGSGGIIPHILDLGTGFSYVCNARMHVCMYICMCVYIYVCIYDICLHVCVLPLCLTKK